MRNFFVLLLALLALQAYGQKKKTEQKAIYLEEISWSIAKPLLTPDAVIVIPLGAGSKEHGPHLPLSTDYIQAESVARLLAAERKVIIAPVISYGFYPSFLRYAGSTSIDFSTSTDMLLSIVRSLAGYGPRRFYVINIGVTTTPTLTAASKVLADEGILLYYTDYDRSNFVKAEENIKTQAFGTHANEIESSNILYLRPDLVDMKKAVNDSSSKGGQGILSPVQMENVSYSPSGIVGYAALATKEKGERYLQAFTREMIKEIDSITTCMLPSVKDRMEEYKKYEGEYEGVGRKNFIIQAKDNQLQFKLADAIFFAPFNLSQNTEDYFSCPTLSVLFVKNGEGKVEKMWCRSRGMSYWMTKIK